MFIKLRNKNKQGNSPASNSVTSPKRSSVASFASLDEVVEQWKKTPWIVKKAYGLLEMIKNIPYGIKSIQWFFQRGRRGFGDNDTWNFDHYLITIIINGLTEFQKLDNTYPHNVASMEEWNAIVGEMIAGFKAAQKIVENLYTFHDMSPDKVNFLERMLTKKEQEQHDRAFELFKKYFYDLWD